MGRVVAGLEVPEEDAGIVRGGNVGEEGAGEVNVATE